MIILSMVSAGPGRWPRLLKLGGGLLLLALVGWFVLNSGPTTITGAQVGRDFQSDQVVGAGTVFQPTDNPLHCVVRLERAVAGTRVRMVWVALEAGNQQNFRLLDRTITVENASQQNIDAFLRLEQPWPPGRYKIDLFLDDKLDRTLEFEIATQGV